MVYNTNYLRDLLNNKKQYPYILIEDERYKLWIIESYANDNLSMLWANSQADNSPLRQSVGVQELANKLNADLWLLLVCEQADMRKPIVKKCNKKK